MRLAPLRSRRAVLTGVHLLLTLTVAVVAAFVVFTLWYPAPYGNFAGGARLFALLVSVDLVLGPLLTAIAAQAYKPLPALRRDLAMIVAIQLAAFVYGMHAIAVARPVIVAFEIDRMRVLTAADVDPVVLADAAPAFRDLSWSGPKVIAAVKPTDTAGALQTVQLALAGFDLSSMPRNWRDYASRSDAAWQAARPLSALVFKYPSAAPDAARIASGAGLPVESLRFLPLVSRRSSWVVLLAAPDARIVGYLPLDGFF